MSPSSTPTSSALSPASSLPSLKCFVKRNNTVTTSPWLPCGFTNSTTPNVPCCASGDFCLSDGLCHYTYSIAGGSGYYAAGCTDQTYKDKTACPQLCDSRLNKDVVYNSSLRIWDCCGESSTGKPNCGNPTNERFNAPAEDQLETYYTAGTKVASTSSSSSSSTLMTATEIITVSPTNTAVSASSGLSTGAAAGVGAVCGVAGLALIGALVFFLVKRRRGKEGLSGNALSYKQEPVELSQDTGRTPPPELASAGLASSQAPKDEESRELHVPIMPQELPADNVPRRPVPATTRDILENLPESLRIRRPGT